MKQNSHTQARWPKSNSVRKKYDSLPQTNIEFWIRFWSEAYYRANCSEERDHAYFMLTTYVKDYYG